MYLPNTLDAHRLIWLAQKEGRQDSIVDALYQGNFVQGLDIGRRRVLVDIANAKGLDVKLVESFLNSNNGIKEVQLTQASQRHIKLALTLFLTLLSMANIPSQVLKIPRY